MSSCEMYHIQLTCTGTCKVTKPEPPCKSLPLASHWNVGWHEGTFTPAYQLELLEAGHHIMPWMRWPSESPGPETDRFKAYYEPLLAYCRKHNLPISFRGTQWEEILYEQSYYEGPEETWAGVIDPQGQRVKRLSPFGPIAVWADPAERFINTDSMRRVQELYPEPPLVLFVGNNEAAKLRWKKGGELEKTSRRYLDLYGDGRDGLFKRKVVGQGWMERYPVMFDAMRDALCSEHWQDRARFVGYNAFGPPHFGRWGSWKIYSLIADQDWTSPDWYHWQGGSPSYYANNYDDSRDHWMWGPQTGFMNLVFMLEEACRVNPDFWFEMSVWDGNLNCDELKEGLAVEADDEVAAKCIAGLTQQEIDAIPAKHKNRHKTLQYLADGQRWPPERYGGWVQYGMWTMRPRVVREFRTSTFRRVPVESYWLQIVEAVDRVWQNELLSEFWQYGSLVPNTAHRHPYRWSIPLGYQTIKRWYGLDTIPGPEWPLHHREEIPVFALALVRGERRSRRWLVYANSPLADRTGLEIMVPDYGWITVDVPQRGAFYLVSETDHAVTPVA